MSKTYNHSLLFLYIATFITVMPILFFPSQVFSLTNESKFTVTENPRAFIKYYSSYVDSDNNTIIVGSVAKSDFQNFPQSVSIGLKAFNNITGSNEIITEEPYNSILSKDNEPFPFKFKINSTMFPEAIKSEPFIFESRNVSLPNTKLNTFKLEYPVIPQGNHKELYGNITNTGPIQLNNITLFAIVNDRNSTQIDSVKTVIPNMKPYETRSFTFVPDPAIENIVYFYSCVGGDIDDMKIDDFQIVNMSSSKVLGYKFSSLIQIDYLNYNSSNNQFRFTINNIYPYPGSLSLQLMPIQEVPLAISIDGSSIDTVSARNVDNKTLLELSIPQGHHDIVISNIQK